ncbi:porin family protein [Pseudochryseolinea flava]|uniref:Outer membrane protein beta-barrel domain-containing protein n=1 Tax=Pseudochryseolinea flava TaxID=2059302 RepID=A0A364Y048_9BACT|nr:porin family protein [Pseudochryseolinea flava]RAV99970.1 hypothetical protein DQQ10_15520 [Pseudochryseolinea flava]
MKKIIVLSLLAFVFSPAFSQETTTKKTSKRPDIPGTFVLELGLNQAKGAPDNFNKAFWGSRTLNFYWTYDIRILKSRFSFVPGIGLSLERWKFKDGRVLMYANDSLLLETPKETGLLRLKQSKLITNYLEIPVEFVYRTRPDDPARSFKIAVGGRVGVLYDAFTKVKYREDGEVKKYKDNQSFDLNKIRYGLTGRVGIGNFSVFTYYNLNSLFETDKGPWVGEGGTAVRPDNFNTFTIGISLSSF